MQGVRVARSEAYVGTSQRRGMKRNEADRFFLGLWEGIDPLDGSTVRVSIANLNKDEKIEIAWTESLFTLCEGANGFITSTGTVDENGVINADEMLTCFDKEETAEGQASYTPVKDDGLIIVTPKSEPDFPPVILHRVSNSM